MCKMTNINGLSVIYKRWLIHITSCLFLSLGYCGFAAAALLDNSSNTLDAISYSTLPGDRIQLRLKMSGPATEPGSFTIDNPARIAFDFPKTKSRLASKSKTIGVGTARSVTAVEAGGRTRVVINLTRLVGYETKIEGNDIIITLSPEQGRVAKTTPKYTPSASPAKGKAVQNIDFRRGDKGEGRIIVTLSDPNTAIDMSKRSGKVLVTIQNASLPDDLERRLDVLDFATPVRTVDAFRQGADVRLVVAAAGRFDHIAYQTDNQFTIDVKPIIKDKKKEALKRKGYRGERLSLNFQNIEVRAVLQLIADFTGKNMVTSDAVDGSVTLRLKNVPWDQALDIILKTKGLAKREAGNVMMIGPAGEIAAQEKIELEANRQIQELAPLVSESIQVNYAKASELVELIKSGSSTMLSDRGSVSVDGRTNKLLITDVDARILSIRRLVEELDVPVKQVLIESRVVIANDDFSKDMGVRFGINGYRTRSDGLTFFGSKSSGNDVLINSAKENFDANGIYLPTTYPGSSDRMNVNLPVAGGNIPSLALAILGSDSLIDLELSALQLEGKGKIISNPRVVTSNSHKALIEQGVEIPYQEASSSGATSISFKKAVLSLEVTPQITPDNRVIMDLKVNKDSVGQVFFGVPSIDTREVQTQVLVSNGETIVLGGVYEQIKSKEVDRVPFFGDLPLIGALFRQTRETDEKNELLIFVTPKILKDIKTF